MSDPLDAELLEQIKKLKLALIEHVDLYWGSNWKNINDKHFAAYPKLSRARQALGMEE